MSEKNIIEVKNSNYLIETDNPQYNLIIDNFQNETEENVIEIVNTDYLIETDNTQYNLTVENVCNFDYMYSANKPKINSVELTGDKSSHDLGLVSLADMLLKENVSNKVIFLSETSTDMEYPSAKCVNDNLSLINTSLNSKLNCNMDNLSATGQIVLDAKANQAVLNLLNNPASALRTALDAKVSKAGDTMSGNLILENELILKNILSFTDNNEIQIGKVDISSPSASTKCARIGVRNTRSNIWSFLNIYANDNGSTGFEFPRATTIPSTSSTASNSKTSVCVSNYRNGGSGYHIYSDGFCIQWGSVAAKATQVYFLRRFVDTGYVIVMTSAYNGTTYSTNVHTRFVDHCNFMYNGAATQMWLACGYLENGQWTP